MTAMHATNRRDSHRISPYSKRVALVTMDRRTKEARLLRDTRAELTAHLGGNPSATQRALIEQAAQLRLHLATMDRTFAETGGKMTLHDSRTYLAWANSYSRLLRLLGLKGAPERGPSLAEILAAGPPARVRTAPPDAPDAMAPPAAQADSGPPAAPAEVI